MIRSENGLLRKSPVPAVYDVDVTCVRNVAASRLIHVMWTKVIEGMRCSGGL